METNLARLIIVAVGLQLAPAAAGLGASIAGAQSSAPRTELRVRSGPSMTIRVVRMGRHGAQPPLVLLSGWTIGIGVWSDVADSLARDREVYLVESRSQGGSSLSLSANTPEDRAGDLARIIDTLRIRRPVVIAWSQGVQDLAAYVAQHGDSAFTASLMVDAMPSPGLSTLRDSPEFSRRILDNLVTYQAHPREFARGMMSAIIGGPDSLALRRELAERALITPVAVGVAMQISDLLGVDRSTTRFTRPVLVVAADGPLTDDLREYAARSGARFEQVKNARHALFLDHRDRFLALVRQFSEEARAAGRR